VPPLARRFESVRRLRRDASDHPAPPRRQSRSVNSGSGVDAAWPAATPANGTASCSSSNLQRQRRPQQLAVHTATTAATTPSRCLHRHLPVPGLGRGRRISPPRQRSHSPSSGCTAGGSNQHVAARRGVQYGAFHSIQSRNRRASAWTSPRAPCDGRQRPAPAWAYTLQRHRRGSRFNVSGSGGVRPPTPPPGAPRTFGPNVKIFDTRRCRRSSGPVPGGLDLQPAGQTNHSAAMRYGDAVSSPART